MSRPQGVPIFYYHAIAEGELAVPPRVFARQMAYLKKTGAAVIPLGRLVEELRAGRSLAGRVCVTFDDGFESTYLHAVPVLRALAFRATFFVPVGYVGQRLWGAPETGRWSTQPGEGAVEFRMMTWDQLRELRRTGMEIGAHSMTHPNLTDIPHEVARTEIADSRTALEERTGAPVRVFAYPRGRSSAALARVVAEAGYIGACTTQRGYATREADPYLLPRLPGGGRVADLVCDVKGLAPRSLAAWLLRAGDYVGRAVGAAKGERA